MRKLGNKIVKVSGPNSTTFCVNVKFQDGTHGIISLKHLFEKPSGLTSEILKGEMFNKCFVESGALAWPNGFELCPDALKQWFVGQHRHEKKIAA